MGFSTMEDVMEEQKKEQKVNIIINEFQQIRIRIGIVLVEEEMLQENVRDGANFRSHVLDHNH